MRELPRVIVAAPLYDLPSPPFSADLKEKKFFPGLIAYMASGPVVAMVRWGSAICRP